MTYITKEEFDDFKIRVFKWVKDNFEPKNKTEIKIDKPLQDKIDKWRKPTQSKIDEIINDLPL
jgi:predicted RNA-binding protein with PIN domain